MALRVWPQSFVREEPDMSKTKTMRPVPKAVPLAVDRAGRQQDLITTVTKRLASPQPAPCICTAQLDPV